MQGGREELWAPLPTLLPDPVQSGPTKIAVFRSSRSASAKLCLQASRSSQPAAHRGGGGGAFCPPKSSLLGPGGEDEVQPGTQGELEDEGGGRGGGGR